MISLLSENILVANSHLRCDALSMFFDLEIDAKEKEKVIGTVFRARYGIEKGMEYCHYEFLDNETGELQELNCRIDLDLMMRKNNYYPKMILQLLNKSL